MKLEKRKEPERGGEGRGKSGPMHEHAQTHVPSLSALAALPLSVVEVGSSEDVVITRKQHKRSTKQTLLTPSLLLQTPRQSIYIVQKKKTCLLILKMK